MSFAMPPVAGGGKTGIPPQQAPQSKQALLAKQLKDQFLAQAGMEDLGGQSRTQYDQLEVSVNMFKGGYQIVFSIKPETGSPPPWFKALVENVKKVAPKALQSKAVPCAVFVNRLESQKFAGVALMKDAYTNGVTYTGPSPDSAESPAQKTQRLEEHLIGRIKASTPEPVAQGQAVDTFHQNVQWTVRYIDNTKTKSWRLVFQSSDKSRFSPEEVATFVRDQLKFGSFQNKFNRDEVIIDYVDATGLPLATGLKPDDFPVIEEHIRTRPPQQSHSRIHLLQLKLQQAGLKDELDEFDA